jgi:hypothetical protein
VQPRENSKGKHEYRDDKPTSATEAEANPEKGNPHHKGDDATSELNAKRKWRPTSQVHVEWRTKNRDNTKSDQKPETLCPVWCRHWVEQIQSSHTPNENKLSDR